MLRIPGKGGGGSRGGPNGDLFLTIRIAAHPDFERKENDLHCALPVELYTAVLGGKTQVTTLKGRVTVKIPKGTANNKVLRLRGLGMPAYGKRNEFGDLLVNVDIVVPLNLSAEEVNLFGKLASLRN
jgi:curved DNA-binding protein